jgi:hypothetical protein
MASRPCKPDADLKRIWRTILPDTPFPACGAPPQSETDADDAAEPLVEPRKDNVDNGS